MKARLRRICRAVDRFFARHLLGEIAIELLCFLTVVWFILLFLRCAVA